MGMPNRTLSAYAAFLSGFVVRPSSTPMMSVSFMIRSSSPSIFTSVPDHLPNSTKSPAFTSGAMRLPLSSTGAGADGDDFAFLRLFLGGVGDDDAAGGFLIFLDAADDHAVAKRTKFHEISLWKCRIGEALRRCAGSRANWHSRIGSANTFNSHVLIRRELFKCGQNTLTVRVRDQIDRLGRKGSGDCVLLQFEV